MEIGCLLSPMYHPFLLLSLLLLVLHIHTQHRGIRLTGVHRHSKRSFGSELHSSPKSKGVETRRGQGSSPTRLRQEDVWPWVGGWLVTGQPLLSCIHSLETTTNEHGFRQWLHQPTSSRSRRMGRHCGNRSLGDTGRKTPWFRRQQCFACARSDLCACGAPATGGK